MARKEVFLEDVAEEMQMVNDESSVFYNAETGEFAYYSAYFPDAGVGPDEFEDEKYIALPSQRDVREYDIMEEFAESVRDASRRRRLQIALEGRGAFRRFKDELIRTNLQENWYAFRDKAFLEIARRWCGENGIPYKQKSPDAPEAAAAPEPPYVSLETLEVILRRRSVRSYRSEQISDDALRLVLTAGQSAPYAAPDSRHFTALQDGALLAQLNAAAKEFARSSGLPQLQKLGGDPDFDGTYGAPTLVVVSGKTDSVQYEAVCAASVQNMLVAAEACGLGACWIYFVIFAFSSPRAADFLRELKIPEGFKPCAAVLLGYGAGKTETEDKRYKNEISWVRGK
jgi:nitroreductase